MTTLGDMHSYSTYSSFLQNKNQAMVDPYLHPYVVFTFLIYPYCPLVFTIGLSSRSERRRMVFNWVFVLFICTQCYAINDDQPQTGWNPRW
jgi:hypothetical protein